jgi:hypothetical protein
MNDADGGKRLLALILTFPPQEKAATHGFWFTDGGSANVITFCSNKQ